MGNLDESGRSRGGQSAADREFTSRERETTNLLHGQQQEGQAARVEDTRLFVRGADRIDPNSHQPEAGRLARAARRDNTERNVATRGRLRR